MMVERDDLADIDDTGPWEREDEEAAKNEPPESREDDAVRDDT